MSRAVLSIYLLGSSLLLLLSFGLVVLSSPWLLWYAEHDSALNHNESILLNVHALPDSISHLTLSSIPIRRTSPLDRIQLLPKTLSWVSLQKTLKAIFIYRAPVSPLLIANISSDNNNFFRNNLTIIGSYNDRELRFAVGPNERIASSEMRKKATSMLDDEIPSAELSVPSAVLRSLPRPLTLSWNALLAKHWKFLPLTPDVIGYVSQFTTTRIILDGDKTAISVTGATDRFAATIEEWVQDAERTQRPRESTFRLPDGTVGKETVPGDVIAVLGPTIEGCRAPTTDRTSVRLCATEQWATASNDNSLAQKPLLDNESWSIDISRAVLEAYCASSDPNEAVSHIACASKSIHASGTNTQALLQLTLPKPSARN